MQHEQYRTAELHRPLRRWLSILLLLAAGPALALSLTAGEGAVRLSGGGLASPPQESALDPELGVPLGAPLVSTMTEQPPAMDGLVESAWEQAPPLSAQLHHGLHGQDPAGTLEMRSLYDEDQVYFLARWETDAPGGEPDAWRNLFTMHWRLTDAGLVSGESTGSEGLACTVACHTATADGTGQLIGIRSETIPPGLDDDLPAGGGWTAGMWTLEWSRPRVSSSPYDQHLTDPDHGYRFFFKLFRSDLEGLGGVADPVSDVHELRLDR